MAKSKKKNAGLPADAVLAWHFLPSDKKLNYGDGRVAKVGQTLSIDDDEETQVCETGMHASEKVEDAAKHQAGPILSRVVVRGDVKKQSDKLCGRHRTVLWMKELTLADLKEIGKKIGDTSMANVTDTDYGLSYLANSYMRPEKGKALVEWAKKNGCDDDRLLTVLAAVPPPAPTKPRLTEKAFLELLHPRVVRTKHEIVSQLGGFYNLKPTDDMFDDMIDQILNDVAGDKVHVIEDFTKGGADGYLRVSRK